MTKLEDFGTKPYYNTTHEDSDTVEDYIKKAKGQELEILKFFKEHPKWHYTPFEVKRWIDTTAPITSIRRAISNLAKRGLLIKTDIKKKGIYGRNNCCWKLKEV